MKNDTASATQPIAPAGSAPEGPLVWRGDRLPPDAGLVRVGAAAGRETLALAGELAANPLAAEALDPRDFSLPHLAAVIADIRRALAAGPGFALVDRLPLQDLPPGQVRAVCWLFAALLARPVAQKWDGTLIYDVRDKGRPAGNGVRPDVTNIAQNFHTDNSYNLCPPHYVALFCLQTGLSGGESGIVSLYDAYNELGGRAPALRDRLHRDFHFDRQREHAPDDAMTCRHPMFERDSEGRLIGRLSRRQVVNGHRLAGVPLDGEALEALEAFEAIMNEPGRARTFRFAPGQVQIIDNRRLAHRREAFIDGPEPEQKRHLIRLWLRDEGRRFYNG